MASLENPFTFVEEGGTRIIVTYNEHRVVGIVSPGAMALASPVWKKFMFPPFPQMPKNSNARVVLERASTIKNIDNTVILESVGTALRSSEPAETEQIANMELKASNPSVEPMEEVDFAEDPAEALLILLNITHLRFTKVPLALPLDTLSDIAILCDQYACVHLVQPWLSQWLVDESTGWKPTPRLFGESCHEKWLFIAWVFGREQVLKEFSSSLVCNLEYSEDDCADLEADCGPMPPGLLGSILRVRRTSIEKAMAIFKKCIDRFDSNSGVLCLHQEAACDAITYGSLLRGLQIRHIYPNLDADDLDTSLGDLIAKLAALKVHVYHNRYYNEEHSQCFATDIAKELNAIMKGIEDPVLESHIEHMKVQRAMLNG